MFINSNTTARTNHLTYPSTHSPGEHVTQTLSHSHDTDTVESNLVEVRCASLGWGVCLCVVHGPIPANEDATLEDLDHFHGHVQGDGNEVAVKDEAGDERVDEHYPRLVRV